MNIQNNQKADNKMAAVSPYISIITRNINGLKSPIKRQRVAGRIKNNSNENIQKTNTQRKNNQNRETRSNYMLPTRNFFQF